VASDSSVGYIVGFEQRNHCFMRDESDGDPQSYRHRVAHLNALRSSHHALQRHDVSPVLWEQRGRPSGRPDSSLNRDHAPAIGHDRRRRLELGALLVGHGDEVEWRWSPPLPHVAAELQFHQIRIDGGSPRTLAPMRLRILGQALPQKIGEQPSAKGRVLPIILV
jgi:hypothetical protein